MCVRATWQDAALLQKNESRWPQGEPDGFARGYGTQRRDHKQEERDAQPFRASRPSEEASLHRHGKAGFAQRDVSPGAINVHLSDVPDVRGHLYFYFTLFAALNFPAGMRGSQGNGRRDGGNRRPGYHRRSCSNQEAAGVRTRRAAPCFGAAIDRHDLCR